MTNLSKLTITNPNQWTKEELYTNLQAAVDLELWTIPLYLTALYSIQNLDNKNQQAYPAAAKLIESVVIEEMLHLQLVCNICNALGYSPQMKSPVYKEADGIPFIKTNVPDKYQGYEVKLGGLDLNQLKLFCVIELPEPPSNPDWTTQNKYNSIGELYQALGIAVKRLWDQLYVGDQNNTKQQANFYDYLTRAQKGDGFSQIVSSLDTALAAMNAIVEQGEGNQNNEIPDPFQPHPKDPSTYDPGDYDPQDSHFVKFNTALDQLISGINVPPTFLIVQHLTKEQRDIQAYASIQLYEGFQVFIQQLQAAFADAQPNNQLPASFFDNMFNLQSLITHVWQTGAVPSFPTAL